MVRIVARMSTGAITPAAEWERMWKEVREGKSSSDEDEKIAKEEKNPRKGSKNSNNKVVKGDVIWVPYRQNPLWPALVHNVYPKKVTYVFFPIAEMESGKKPAVFSCNPKSVYCLSVGEQMPLCADQKLVEAVEAAKDYLLKQGKVDGSEAPRRPETKPKGDDKDEEEDDDVKLPDPLSKDKNESSTAEKKQKNEKQQENPKAGIRRPLEKQQVDTHVKKDEDEPPKKKTRRGMAGPGAAKKIVTADKEVKKVVEDEAKEEKEEAPKKNTRRTAKKNEAVAEKAMNEEQKE